jgi:hypothetical protein
MQIVNDPLITDPLTLLGIFDESLGNVAMPLDTGAMTLALGSIGSPGLPEVLSTEAA